MSDYDSPEERMKAYIHSGTVTDECAWAERRRLRTRLEGVHMLHRRYATPPSACGLCGIAWALLADPEPEGAEDG